MSSPEFRDDFFGMSDAVYSSLSGYLFDETDGPRSVHADEGTISTDHGYGVALSGLPMSEAVSEPIFLLAVDAFKQIFPDKVQPSVWSEKDPLLSTITVQDAQAITDGVMRFMAGATRSEALDG